MATQRFWIVTFGSEKIMKILDVKRVGIEVKDSFQMMNSSLDFLGAGTFPEFIIEKLENCGRIPLPQEFKGKCGAIEGEYESNLMFPITIQGIDMFAFGYARDESGNLLLLTTTAVEPCFDTATHILIPSNELGLGIGSAVPACPKHALMIMWFLLQVSTADCFTPGALVGVTQAFYWLVWCACLLMVTRAIVVAIDRFTEAITKCFGQFTGSVTTGIDVAVQTVLPEAQLYFKAKRETVNHGLWVGIMQSSVGLFTAFVPFMFNHPHRRYVPENGKVGSWVKTLLGGLTGLAVVGLFGAWALSGSKNARKWFGDPLAILKESKTLVWVMDHAELFWVNLTTKKRKWNEGFYSLDTKKEDVEAVWLQVKRDTVWVRQTKTEMYNDVPCFNSVAERKDYVKHMAEDHHAQASPDAHIDVRGFLFPNDPRYRAWEVALEDNRTIPLVRLLQEIHMERVWEMNFHTKQFVISYLWLVEGPPPSTRLKWNELEVRLSMSGIVRYREGEMALSLPRMMANWFVVNDFAVGDAYERVFAAGETRTPGLGTKQWEEYGRIVMEAQDTMYTIAISKNRVNEMNEIKLSHVPPIELVDAPTATLAQRVESLREKMAAKLDEFMYVDDGIDVTTRKTRLQAYIEEKGFELSTLQDELDKTMATAKVKAAEAIKAAQEKTVSFTDKVGHFFYEYPLFAYPILMIAGGIVGRYLATGLMVLEKKVFGKPWLPEAKGKQKTARAFVGKRLFVKPTKPKRHRNADGDYTDALSDSVKTEHSDDEKDPMIDDGDDFIAEMGYRREARGVFDSIKKVGWAAEQWRNVRKSLDGMLRLGFIGKFLYGEDYHPESGLGKERVPLRNYFNRLFHVTYGDNWANGWLVGDRLYSSWHVIENVRVGEQPFAYNAAMNFTKFGTKHKVEGAVDLGYVTVVPTARVPKIPHRVPVKSEGVMFLAFDSCDPDTFPSLSEGIMAPDGRHTCSSQEGNCGGVLISGIDGAVIGIHNAGGTLNNRASVADLKCPERPLN